MSTTAFAQKWRADRIFRREDLASGSGEYEYDQTLRAWRTLVQQWRAPTKDEHVTVPLSLLQSPDWSGTPTARPRRTGRGRPSRSYRASVLSSLASGGSDALALRLFLTIVAVSHLARRSGQESSVSTIPIASVSKKVSWSALTRIGPSHRRMETPGAKRKAIADSSVRSRIVAAIKRLESLNLIIVRRNGHGRVAGIDLAPFPDDPPVATRAGCRDAVVPLGYWTRGWNAVLWADDVVTLMAFLAAPHQLMFALYEVDPATGVIDFLGHTTRKPDDAKQVFGADPLDPSRQSLLFYDRGGRRIYVYRDETVRFLAEGKRSQQFGIHDNRYRKVGDLEDFQVFHRRISENASNLRPRGERLAIREPSEAGVKATQGLTRCYQVRTEAFNDDARACLLAALQRSQPVGVFDFDDLALDAAGSSA